MNKPNTPPGIATPENNHEPAPDTATTQNGALAGAASQNGHTPDADDAVAVTGEVAVPAKNGATPSPANTEAEAPSEDEETDEDGEEEDTRPAVPATTNGLIKALGICGLSFRANARSGNLEVTPTDRYWADQYSKIWADDPLVAPDGSYVLTDARLECLRNRILPAKVRRARKGKEPTAYNLSKASVISHLTGLRTDHGVDPFWIWLDGIDQTEKDPGPGIWLRFFVEGYGLQPSSDQPADYLVHIARLFILPPIARAAKPGSISRVVPILIGNQIKGKSAGPRNLFPEEWQPHWFSDELPLHSTAKERIELTIGPVTIEAAELSGLERAAIAALKTSLGQTQDRARLAFDRATSLVPRRWNLVGTANDQGSGVLPEDTENTRFLVAVIPTTSTPQRVEKWLQANRRLLWKRGLVEYQEWGCAGDAPWFLTPSVQITQAEVNDGLVSKAGGVEGAVREMEALVLAARVTTPLPIVDWMVMAGMFGKAATVAESAMKVSAGPGAAQVKSVTAEMTRRKWVKARPHVRGQSKKGPVVWFPSG